jgi:hypothetical protein
MSDKLAVDGGQPVRDSRLPYGRQWLDEDDIQVVVEVLQSDWLTTGPKVAEFENAFSDYIHTREAVAVSNGTAALHTAVYAAGIGPEDIAFICLVYDHFGNDIFSWRMVLGLLNKNPDWLDINRDVAQKKIQ